MSGNENKIDPTSDAPLTDEEFDAWWPFSDDDLDEYERGIVEAFRDHELVFPPHLDEERRQARMRVRRELAEKYPDGLPGAKAAAGTPAGQPNTAAPAADDDA